MALFEDYNQFCQHSGFATFPIIGYIASFYLARLPIPQRHLCATVLEKYRGVTSYIFVDERPLEALKNVAFSMNDFGVWRELVRQSQRSLFEWIAIRELLQVPTV